MKLQEKINLFKENNYKDWIFTRQKVENKLSALQSMKCVCGRLATGLHEMNCIKFKNKVDKLTYETIMSNLKNYENNPR